LRPSWLSLNLSHQLVLASQDLSPLTVFSEQLTLRKVLGLVQNAAVDRGVAASNPRGRSEEERSSSRSSSRPVTPSPRKTEVKIDVRKKNKFGETPLHLVCKNKNGSMERLEMILATPNVDVNARDNNGWTALHEAIGAGRAECVKRLLAYNPRTIDYFLMVTSHFIVRVMVRVLETVCELENQPQNKSSPTFRKWFLGSQKYAVSEKSGPNIF
jgi:hypothetical protein